MGEIGDFDPTNERGEASDDDEGFGSQICMLHGLASSIDGVADPRRCCMPSARGSLRS